MPTVVKKKKRGPKYLEKMLFVNHKEDQMLQERLDNLHVKSRLREIELDRERIKVRDEWKDSRKKQIPIEFLAALQQAPSSAPVNSPPRRKVGVVERPRLLQRQQSANASPKIQTNSNKSSSSDSDNVNSYLLGEYRRMSEVIPSILLALSKKDEKKNTNESSNFRMMPATDDTVLEPDLHRITKLVRTIKTMRENLSFKKNIDMNRPKMSLAKMFKDINEKRHEIDQYTDGTCALLKRKLEKRRRQSVAMADIPPMEEESQNIPSFEDETTSQTDDSDREPDEATTSNITVIRPLSMNPAQQRNNTGASLLQRPSSLRPSLKRNSISVSDNQRTASSTKRFSISSEIPGGRQRSSQRNSASSMHRPQSFNQLSQRHSVAITSQRPTSLNQAVKRFSVGSIHQRPNNLGFPKIGTGTPRNIGHSARHLEGDSKQNYIDEDEFKAKQRVAKELRKYDRIKQRVDKFLATDKISCESRKEMLYAT